VAINLNSVTGAATEKLIALHGIGRWTAEAYLMVCEARTDVFPAADIALQEAIRILDGAPLRPSTAELYARSELWRPYRSIAAHLLYAYYTGIKRNSIPMPPGVPPMMKPPSRKPKPATTKSRNIPNAREAAKPP
jgi:DNA-3-methyladenine glycosylase II